MITERFPELNQLDPEEKLLLAGELWTLATETGSKVAEDGLPASVIQRIEQRLDEYLANPGSAIKERKKHIKETR